MEITAEVHFAQRLACSQPKLAEKTLKKVGKWLAIKSVHKDAFTEESLLKLWKGVFYFFWNADKPLVQEEKADVISSYIHVFKSVDCAFLYIDTFFQTMAREWLTIDRFRIEKFMMLIRKFLHQTYQLLKQLKWEIKWIKEFRKVLRKTVINAIDSMPLGLKLHISDIYMEELAKVAAEELTPDMTKKFLIPFCKVLVESDDSIYVDSISKDVFLYLLNQSADEECFEEFPVLKFDPQAVQNILMKYANKPVVKTMNMKAIYDIIKEFEDYKNGVNALDRLYSDTRVRPKLRKRDFDRAAMNLFNDEVSYSTENKKVKKSKLYKDVIDL